MPCSIDNLVDQSENANSYKGDGYRGDASLSSLHSQHALTLEYFRLLQLQLMMTREVCICTKAHECRCSYRLLDCRRDFMIKLEGIYTNEPAGQAIIPHITLHDVLCRFHLLEFFDRRCAAPHGDWSRVAPNFWLSGLLSKGLKLSEINLRTANRDPWRGRSHYNPTSVTLQDKVL